MAKRPQRSATSTGAGAAVRQFVRDQSEAQNVFSGAGTQSRPRSDPGHQTAASLFSFENTSRLIECSITDSTPIGNCYRVQFEKGCLTMPAFYMGRASHGAIGVRDIGCLTPGTRCLAVVHPSLTYATILGPIPEAGDRADLGLQQLIASASRARVDTAHKWPSQSHAGGNVRAWDWGRAYDGTHGGEQGWISDTGIQIFIDTFMAKIAVDEACGLTVFEHDQMLRLAAYNLQFWNAGFVREALNDQDEIYDVEGFTPYPWEQLGRFSNVDPRRELPPESWLNSDGTPYYGKWEPVDDWQMPWHRTRIFRGYLGQSEKTILVAPPKGYADTDYARYDGAGGHGGDKSTTEGAGSGKVGAEHPALGEVTRMMDGRLLIQSAKGLALVKRLGTVAPAQLHRPEQPQTGDTPDDYMFAGLKGSGPAHTITGDLATDAAVPEMQRAAGVLDLHAYLFNYAGVHPFHYHSKDWKLPEESALEWTGGVSHSVETTRFEQLADKYSLPAPDPYKLKIDHRYGEQDYYPNEAGFAILDDGGLVIFDGFGGEIKMTGGNISISCPGDVFLKPGRNLMSWAGHDMTLRAKNSVDVTATDHDVRIKAENHCHLTAGNSGEGSLLLECRAEGATYDFSKQGEDLTASGIILKAKSSEIVGLAHNIYLRTGGGDIEPGAIIIDAAKGQEDVIINARNLNQFITGGAYHFFSDVGAAHEILASNVFSRETCSICATVGINGELLVQGDVILKGWVFVAEGHIATEQAQGFNLMVGPLQGEGLRRVYEALSEEEILSDNTLPQAGNTFYQEELYLIVYQADRPGDDSVITDMEFSLRSLQQYRSSDFKVFEDRWQQLARLTGQTSSTWEEKQVLWHGVPTWPFPGPPINSAIYYEQELTIFDPEAGCSKDRGANGQTTGPYTNPKYGSINTTQLNGNYPIIG